MQKLISTLELLSGEIACFTQDLEDNYDLPGIGKKVNYFTKRLKECADYQPAEMDDAVDDLDDNETLLYGLRLNCREALAELKTVTSKSNVFDIIDVLRSVYVIIRRYLPSEMVDMRDFYDLDDVMEADRTSRELSTPFKNEWD